MVLNRLISKTLVAAIMVFVALFMGASTTTAQNVQAYCYVGDPTDNEYIGTVDFVKPSQAASACDALYFDCEGHCTGCFKNDDSEELCVDPTGRVYSP